MTWLTGGFRPVIHKQTGQDIVFGRFLHCCKLSNSVRPIKIPMQVTIKRMSVFYALEQILQEKNMDVFSIDKETYIRLDATQNFFLLLNARIRSS